MWTYQHDAAGRPIVGEYVLPEWRPLADESTARECESRLISELNPTYNRRRPT